MAPVDRLQIARECYRAFETGDRTILERHLSSDFEFYSPADPGIGRARYFERCWPGAQQIAGYEYRRLFDAGDEVFVTYVCTREDGTRFCNTEVLTFAGDKVRRAEVYFGWNLD